MPFNRPIGFNRSTALDALHALDQALRPAGWVLGWLAGTLLLATGEALAWRGIWPGSRGLLLGVHLVSGGLLALIVAYRSARGLLRWLRLALRQRHLGRPSPWHLLATLTWLLFWAAVLSGGILHLQLRDGISVPGGLTPVRWIVLHQLVVPYLITALLMIAFVRARGALQRLRAYLLSP